LLSALEERLEHASGLPATSQPASVYDGVDHAGGGVQNGELPPIRIGEGYLRGACRHTPADPQMRQASA